VGEGGGAGRRAVRTPRSYSPVGDSLIPGLQANRVDVAFGALGTNAARQQITDFVSWVNSSGTFLAMKNNNLKISSMDDLCGKKVASTLGGQTTDYANAYSKACVASGKPAIDVQTFANTTEDVLAVSSGRADLWYGSGVNVSYTAQQSKGTLAVIGTDSHEPTPLGITFLKGSSMVQAITAAINYLITNGQYKPILEKWGVQAGALDKAVFNPAPTS
jgi:polar amino acid transport system substrate-binding protein